MSRCTRGAISRAGMSRAAAKTLASSSMSGTCRRRPRAGRADASSSGRTAARRPVVVHAPMAELVADREAAARRPSPCLLGVDPDLAAVGQQQAGESGPVSSSGRPAPRPCPRHREPAARSRCRRSPRPAPAGSRRPRSMLGPARDRLGALLDLLHRARDLRSASRGESPLSRPGKARPPRPSRSRDPCSAASESSSAARTPERASPFA